MKRLVKNVFLALMLLQVSFGVCLPTLAKTKVLGDTIVQIKEFHYEQSADTSNLSANINYFQIIGNSDLANVVNNMVLDVYMGMAQGLPINPNIMVKEYFDIQDKEIDTLIEEMDEIEILPYSFDYIAKVELNNELIFTFKQVFYEYTGGAHGIGFEVYHNIDAKNGDKLNLNNLFNEKEIGFLTVMGENALRQGQSIPNNTTLKEWGYEFEEEFYLSTNFLITDSGIVFYYAPYEIACYAIGATEFELPFYAILAKCPNAKLFEYIK